MNQSEPVLSDKSVETVIADLLRAGVLISALVVLAGGILFLSHHASPPVDYRVFRGEASDLRGVPAIFRQALKLDPRGLIQFGFLLLIATPVVRVLFTVFAFAYERDWTYVVITLFVLGLLIFSLAPWRL
jgi:uncharacterized membrane protein